MATGSSCVHWHLENFVVNLKTRCFANLLTSTSAALPLPYSCLSSSFSVSFHVIRTLKELECVRAHAKQSVTKCFCTQLRLRWRRRRQSYCCKSDGAIIGYFKARGLQPQQLLIRSSAAFYEQLQSSYDCCMRGHWPAWRELCR